MNPERSKTFITFFLPCFYHHTWESQLLVKFLSLILILYSGPRKNKIGKIARGWVSIMSLTSLIPIADAYNSTIRANFLSQMAKRVYPELSANLNYGNGCRKHSWQGSWGHSDGSISRPMVEESNYNFNFSHVQFEVVANIQIRLPSS